jgi:hypothetical protein
MSEVDLQAEIARLQAENDLLKGRSERGITLKVIEKGALSVYGLGRFPVSLYKEQWRRVLPLIPYCDLTQRSLPTKAGLPSETSPRSVATARAVPSGSAHPRAA